MKIQITEDAANWYKNEYDLEEGTFRFFVRYGGFGGQIPGFSLGVTIEEPNTVHASVQVDSLEFYIEDSDAWYFENRDLYISLDNNLNEPLFTYQ